MPADRTDTGREAHVRVEVNERGTPFLFFPDDESEGGEGCREATVAEWHFAARLAAAEDEAKSLRGSLEWLEIESARNRARLAVAEEERDAALRDKAAAEEALREIDDLPWNLSGKPNIRRPKIIARAYFEEHPPA